jgi:hypothetical protein
MVKDARLRFCKHFRNERSSTSIGSSWHHRRADDRGETQSRVLDAAAAPPMSVKTGNSHQL